MSGTGIAEIDIDRVAEALGPAPPVAYAAAHAYPASAPMWNVTPCEERERPDGKSLRLYVHLPFCNYRCNFCFFAVKVGSPETEMKRYVDALKRELEWAEAGTPLSQMFVGGGTPTVLPPKLMDELLGTVFDRFPSEGTHIHVVEASPESILPEHVEVMIRRGIGRISMGTQSLVDDVLNDVRRKHSAQQTLDACDMIVKSGMILNVDLMYGLPGQTHESFRRDFEKLAEHGVQSLTVYDLRLNEQTPVARFLAAADRLELEKLINWRLFVRKTARELGYEQSRWHTFKRMDTAAARHQRAPHHKSSGSGFQLGIGMSARSHLGQTVYRNHEKMGDYLDRIESGKSPVEYSIRLGEDDRRTLYLTSTLGDGKALQVSDYHDVFGNTIENDFGPALDRLIQGELISRINGHLAFTDVGRLVYDRVTFNFYPKRVLDWLHSRRAPGGMGMMKAS